MKDAVILDVCAGANRDPFIIAAQDAIKPNISVFEELDATNQMSAWGDEALAALGQAGAYIF